MKLSKIQREVGAFGGRHKKPTKHTQHLRHRTLLRTHAKSELHILHQMEPDELIFFAEDRSIDIREERKVGKEAILTKILADPGVIKARKEMKC